MKHVEELLLQRSGITTDLNDLGIFLEDQQPDLEHLTAEHSSTRDAASAEVEPVEQEPSLARCPSCGETVKTMYVKAAYKDPFQWFGYTFYNHYAGRDSTDIATGQHTSASFEPRWNGIEQGIIPYCYTSSVTLPADATYALGMSVRDTDNTTLFSTFDHNISSHFVWYDTNDQIGNQEINNQANGLNIYCNISSVTVS